ncbi:extracellular solute-binding protein [Scandinavium goeteborgense]|uniref:extracellular solute-binding protein n=2 Tax=Scandinavium goeteborgense TaxID=1851514 RepID=UPI000F67AC9B|nr:extracellular solute-binding protein [Scandinavium goeteborgense]QKN81776.1 extracellular solute-binding protein [Scandinavium goeteborgense]
MKKIVGLIGLTLLISFSCQIQARSDNGVIYFYNWTEYVPDSLLEQFTRETGIKVIYSNYESNEILYAKMKTGSVYDLVVPSSYYVAKMRKEGMLQKINKDVLTNFKNLDPLLLNKPFDRNNEYSVPYIWGATVIAVNYKNISPNSIHGWSDLWAPRFRSSLLLIDDDREVFHIALRKLGYSGNTTNVKQIQQAAKELMALSPNVLLYDGDNPGNPFIEGDVDVGMIWNGSAYVASKAGVPLKVIWPKEGAIFWMDSLAIPAGAQNKEGALKLINFLLRPDVAAAVAERIGYPTPNLAARALLPPEIQHNPMLYPDAETLKNGEWQDDVGSATEIYEEAFERTRAGP